MMDGRGPHHANEQNARGHQDNWQGQQSGSGGAGGVGGGGGGAPGSGAGPQSDQVLQQVPPQFRALMPPFMYRGNSGGGGGGNNGGGGGGGNGGGGASGFGSFGGTSSSNYNSSHPGVQGHPSRPRSQPGAQSGGGNNNYMDNHHHGNQYGGDRGNSGGAPQNYRGRGSGGRGGGRGDDHHRSLPYVEPELAMLQRPIIKEEELERIDSIAKNEGWCKYDKIDYNLKLNFSDDEATDAQQKDQQKSGAAKNKTEAGDGKQSGAKEEQDARNMSNGHWGDADRQRRNAQAAEDERKAYERKQAATKKLHELESKLGPKKSGDLAEEAPQLDRRTSPGAKTGANDQGSMFRAMTDVRSYMNRNVSKVGEKGGRNEFGRGGGGGGGTSAYDGKYDRDRDGGQPRDRHNSSSSGGGPAMAPGQQVERDRDGNVIFFSKQFLSNLPPRFQNSVGSERPTTGSSGPASGQGPQQQQQQGGGAQQATDRRSGGYGGGGGGAGTDKNIPFAQQFDIRYINTNANGGRMG